MMSARLLLGLLAPASEANRVTEQVCCGDAEFSATNLLGFSSGQTTCASCRSQASNNFKELVGWHDGTTLHGPGAQRTAFNYQPQRFSRGRHRLQSAVPL